MELLREALFGREHHEVSPPFAHGARVNESTQPTTPSSLKNLRQVLTHDLRRHIFKVFPFILDHRLADLTDEATNK
jgi:hypothetical protein